jgi:amino acid transporter
MAEFKNEKPEGFSSEVPIKSEYSIDDGGMAERNALSDPNHVELQRALKARHITMIAIGGAIGTGLIIGTGEALAKAGPGSILISYAWVGFIVYLVMCALGEMAAWLPLPSGFTGYAVRFCDPALGFAVGWT